MKLHLVGGDTPDEGEIVITGPQLAEGYWNDPAQTARSFRDVLLDGKVARGYFSGDWALRRDGHTIVRGRLDFQVKVQGHRLELDEVAAAIRTAGWPEVCVLMWRNQLAAVIEAQEASAYDETTLRRALAAKLEAHAVPSIIVTTASMPRNENDKIDRNGVSAWLDALNPHLRENRRPE
jgi:D-alanine--poly(phosphoribitol) ligase subunit 1